MGIIKNRGEVESSQLRKDALDMVESGIEAVLPVNIMMNSVGYKNGVLTVQGKIVYRGGGRIFVVGGGKAAVPTAECLEQIIGAENIEDGVVNAPTGYQGLKKIRVVKASHPTPDEAGVEGVRQMLSLKEEHDINEKDLVIFLISGGGSALMPYPVKSVPLKDYQRINDLLVGRADIRETNTVRKHLSKTKGGQFGKYFAPTKVVSLILSDVVGDKLSVIASGPTAPDPSTYAQAIAVLKKPRGQDRRILWNKAPKSVKNYLTMGASGLNPEEYPETPKEGELTNCHNNHYLIGNNSIALEAMARRARELGYKPFIVAEQEGDVGKKARARVREILDGKYRRYDVVLIGGETSVVLPKKHGVGGRNQHFAAVSMVGMKRYQGQWVVASVGTDGQDFMEGVAGAIVDNTSLESVRNQGLDPTRYLGRYDSYSLLKKIGGSLIKTGMTGTNVCDVMVYILK